MKQTEIIEKLQALVHDHESLINGDKVYADIDIWSDAKDALNELKNHGVSHHVSDLIELWAVMSHGEVVSLHISKEGAEVNSEIWESKGGTYVVVKVPVFS
jgi:hypothetical protein